MGLFGCSRTAGTPPEIAARLNRPVPSSLLATLRKASKAGLDLAKAPDVANFRPIAGPRLSKRRKVGVLYVGADFCPFCASDRWALVLTLIRFGELHGLEYMASSVKDAFPNTVTFTFSNVTYSSNYVKFEAVEVANRAGKSLGRLSKIQDTIFAKFDAPPYQSSADSIPFVYIGGRYLLTKPIALPGGLTGMSWKEVVTALADPKSELFQNIMPQVNAMTAAICTLDGGDPGIVCLAPGIIVASRALLEGSAAPEITSSK